MTKLGSFCGLPNRSASRMIIGSVPLDGIPKNMVLARRNDPELLVVGTSHRGHRKPSAHRTSHYIAEFDLELENKRTD